MAAALGERVVLGRPVRRIEHDGTGVRVIARDGSQYRGDAAVVTLPPTLAGRLGYDSPLPSWRDQLTQRMPAGSVIKTYAIYRPHDGQPGRDRRLHRRSAHEP
jgi:monoamine oxidase